MVTEIPVGEPTVEALPVKESFKQICKRLIKKNEMLYFLARKTAYLFRTHRNFSKARESQPEIAIPAIESPPDTVISAINSPSVEIQPGIRIPAIESYILINDSERLSAQ